MNHPLAYGNAFGSSLATGFLGIHPSAEMSSASGIGEDSGRGWGVWDNLPPSESASANKLRSHGISPSVVIVSRRRRLEFVRSQELPEGLPHRGLSSPV